MMTNFSRVTFALAALFMTSGAQASLVQWELKDVVFDDGGVATGSFSYDRDTNTFSSLSITTTVGNTLPGAFYEFLIPEIPSDSNSLFVSPIANPVAGTTIFAINLVSQMTNAGGTIDLQPAPSPFAFEGSCQADFCSQYTTPLRGVISGMIVSTVVPVPAAIWLFGSAIGLLGWVRRKQPDRHCI